MAFQGYTAESQNFPGSFSLKSHFHLPLQAELCGITAVLQLRSSTYDMDFSDFPKFTEVFSLP